MTNPALVPGANTKRDLLGNSFFLGGTATCGLLSREHVSGIPAGTLHILDLFPLLALDTTFHIYANGSSATSQLRFWFSRVISAVYPILTFRSFGLKVVRTAHHSRGSLPLLPEG